MSLVGPRPLPMRDFERLEDWHKKRYLVLPGITGLWQVSGRSELDFDDLVRLDFLYLERWSMFLDLSILLKTIPAVLSAGAARSELSVRSLVGSRARCRRPTASSSASPPSRPRSAALRPLGRHPARALPGRLPRDRHRGRGDRRARRDRVVPGPLLCRAHLHPGRGADDEGYELFGFVSFSEGSEGGGPERLRGPRRLHLRDWPSPTPTGSSTSTTT